MAGIEYKKFSIGTFLIALLVLAVVGYGLSAVINTIILPTGGSFVVGEGISVFADEELSVPLNEINWGTVYFNSTINKKMYLNNSLSFPVQMSMNTSDWDPIETEQCFNVTWDVENEIIKLNEPLPATVSLTLIAVPENATNFTFNIIITGVQVAA